MIELGRAGKHGVERMQYNKKLLAIMIFFCLLTIVIILPGPNSIQTTGTSESTGEPRDDSGEEPELPHLTVDNWVYPTQIYKPEDTRLPNSADVLLTVSGAGDPVSHGVGPSTADIVFVVDTTGSMGTEISEVQADITEIVNDITVNMSNVKFGLASYRDHPGYYSLCSHYSNTYGASTDWPFRIDQDLTSDYSAFKTAVSGLYRGGGEDEPESVADAIYLTTHNFTWRGGDVAKVALLMGDAPAHNCDNTFGKWGNYSCTGLCPCGYIYKNVVADSATNKVIWATIGMDGTEYNNTLGWAQWNYLCEQTGGKFRALGAEDLTELIVDLIGNVVPTIRIAGKEAIVKMEVPSYISIIDNSLDPPPSSIIGGKTYTWDIGTLGIEQRFTIEFEVQATEAGLKKLVYNLPETRLEYMAWDGSDFITPTTIVFPNATIDVWKSPWELNPPVSSIIHPMNNKLYGKMASITGQAMDPDEGTVLDKVEISIIRVRDNYYWEGSGWTAVETWLTCNGTFDWLYDSGSVTWNSNTQYIIKSRATDEDFNIEVPGEGVIFSMDLDAPWSYIEFPTDNSFLNNIPALTGASTDTGGAGIDVVEICILKQEDQMFWSGKTWRSGETWLTTKMMGASTRANTLIDQEEMVWSFEGLNVGWITDKYYNVHVRATDKVGNIEPPGEGVTFMYDDVPPGCSIDINNDNEYTTTPNVELTLTAQDTGSGVARMALSEVMNESAWTSGQDFADFIPFKLSTGDGEKYVYLKVEDRAGNVAFPIFDTIILDTKPPENLSIIINNDAKYANSIDAILSLYATDATSGLNNMSFSFDKSTWTEFEPFQFMSYLYIPNKDGVINVYFKVSDNAGNIAEPIKDSIILDTTPPQYLSIFINNGSMETNSTDVNLTFSAWDELSGVDQMTISIDGKNWSSWELFIRNMNFTLIPTDGEKIVYFRAKDLVGNVADPVNATIILNTTVPQEQVIKPKTHTSSDYNWLYLLIILIIILTLLAFAYLRRRKRRQFRPLPPPHAPAPAPPTGIATFAQVPEVPPPAMPPLATTSAPIATISTPQYATPIPAGRVPAQLQMVPVAKTMQLPPAQIQK